MLIRLYGERIPLVCDRAKPKPHYWKYPGGKGEGDETPEATAIREVEEETGIVLTKDALQELFRENRGTHTFVLFEAQARLPQPGLKQRGNEGENVALFVPGEMLTMMDFFPSHHRASKMRLAALAHEAPTVMP